MKNACRYLFQMLRGVGGTGGLEKIFVGRANEGGLAKFVLAGDLNCQNDPSTSRGQPLPTPKFQGDFQSKFGTFANKPDNLDRNRISQTLKTFATLSTLADKPYIIWLREVLEN